MDWADTELQAAVRDLPGRPGESQVESGDHDASQLRRFDDGVAVDPQVLGDGTGPGLRWEPKEAPERAYYCCVNGCVIEESAKLAMDEAGEWRAAAPEAWPSLFKALTRSSAARALASAAATDCCCASACASAARAPSICASMRASVSFCVAIWAFAWSAAIR